MHIGVPQEGRDGQRLVAATPRTVCALIELGHQVSVEAGAGVPAGFPDADYTEAGATITDDAWTADCVLKVDPPALDEVPRLRSGSLLCCLLAPARSPELLTALAECGVTALAMDAVPRISRAQALDVLSSQANLAGYRAVVEAAHAFGGLFSGQVTAAGKIQPAKVFVAGAGVAGLAAVGASVSLGAQVRAFDVRPEVAEQVASMGADFVRLELPDAPARTDGYAAELSALAETATAAMYDEQARAADIVITTANIPGRPAPRLISAETVAAMRPGSVVVDLAAGTGGNVAGTVVGEQVVTPGGVTILGYTDLAGRMPAQASQLYGTNLVNLLKVLADNESGRGTVDVDFADAVVRGMTVTRDGEVTWPPPPISVSAEPAPAPATQEPVAAVPDPRRRWFAAGLAGVLGALGVTFAPPSFLVHLTVFALAVIVGFYVISHVTHALHTPLMSVTNAISGIIAIGALLQVGSDNAAITVLALIGTVVASINIFGGFAVTQRMLRMFRRADR